MKNHLDQPLLATAESQPASPEYIPASVLVFLNIPSENLASSTTAISSYCWFLMMSSIPWSSWRKMEITSSTTSTSFLSLSTSDMYQSLCSWSSTLACSTAATESYQVLRALASMSLARTMSFSDSWMKETVSLPALISAWMRSSH